MATITKQRQFEILREVLALAEEQESVPLDEAAAAVGIGAAQLRALLDPVLYLAFREQQGHLVDHSRAFLLDEHDMLRIDEGHWLRNLTSVAPDRETALALFVAATTMQALATRPTPDLDRAARKLTSHLQVVLRMPVHVPEHLAVVQQAWNEGRSLRIRYLRDGADEARDREILPWRVFSQWGHWYVHARDVTEAEPKYFRLDRVLTASLGEVRFDPPDHDEIPEWFDLSEHARTVRVRMRSNALESLPAPHQLGDAVECGDGEVELDITVHGDRRLDHLLVSLPADAVVVAPDGAAERRRAYAARLLAAYS
jgi:predicted DNA-binding transcriptional regulator YafY